MRLRATRLRDDGTIDLTLLTDEELALLEHVMRVGRGERPSMPPAAAAAELRRLADRIAPPPSCDRCASIDERDVVRVPAGDRFEERLAAAREAIAAVAAGTVELVVDG